MNEKESIPQLLADSPLFGKINMSNIDKVIETAKKTKSMIKAGKIWEKRVPPAGELIIIGAILFNNTAVSSVEFHPTNGYILPRGYHPHIFSVSISNEKIEENFNRIIKEFQIGKGAEYREPESCWEFPLIYKGLVVSHIKVYYDGIHILPDFVINQEMKIYK